MLAVLYKLTFQLLAHTAVTQAIVVAVP